MVDGNGTETTDVVEDGEETGSNQATVEEKQFTQTEVNSLIEQRLKRERTKYERQASEQAEALRISSLDDTEKAIETAKLAARDEVRKEYAMDLAAAQIKAELTGLVDDPASVVEDLNLSKFINPEDFSTNLDEVKKLKTKFQSLLDGRKHRSTKNLQPGRSDNIKASTPKDDFAAFLGQ
jgi:hypothetical protein